MRSLLVLPVLGLATCTAPLPPAPTGSPTGFAQELAGRVAGSPQTCISKFPNQNLRVIDDRTIAYEVGTTLWVNRLQASCPALSPYNTLIVESAGSQYCRGNRVRGAEPGAIIPGPTCNLQDWVPYRIP